MQPLISVIMPAYCCEKTVAESIRSALAQSGVELEVVVIDDGSTDGTYGILLELAEKDSRVRPFQNTENIGVAATRNRAVSIAQGEYLAFLDGDDLWEPRKLLLQVEKLRESGCDFCYTSYSFINQSGAALGQPYLVPDAVSFRDLLLENVIGLSTVLGKAELFRRHPMRADYAHEDYVLWLELLQNSYRACGIREVLMRYRVSPSNRSGDKRKAARNRWRIYRSFLHMSLPAAGFAFLHYALHGIRKHTLRQRARP